MPDPSSFMVGNAPNYANYANPLLGLALGNQLQKLPEEYQAGQLRNAFPNGLPQKNGQIDTNAVADTLVKIGGAPYAQQMMEFLLSGQGGNAVGNILDRARGANNQPQASQASPQAPAPASPTMQTARYGITGGQQQGPQQQQTAESPSSPPPAGNASGQPAPNGGRGAARPVTDVGSAGGLPSAGANNSQAQQLRQTAATIRANVSRVPETKYNKSALDGARSQADSLDAQALELEKADIAAREPTGPIKEYNLYAQQQRQQGQPVLPMNQWQVQNEAEKSAATTSATKDVAALDEMRTTGIEAKRQLAQIDAIRTLSKKIGYGAVPSIQEWLGKWGVATTGLSDIQAYQAAISLMAPQLRPEGSGRLLQGELNAFKDSLGGLMRTPEGRELALNNLALVGQYKAEVGRIATDTKLSPAQRIEKIYSLDPPHLVTELPGQTKGGGNTAAAPQYKEGDILTHRTTGHQIKATANGWVDLQTGKPIKSDKLAK